MSAQGFRSLYMAAGVAGAALGCYLVSLNVASERSKLEAVEAEIAMTQRDIRVLQTEIGTRGRLAQLERWNANFIRLSAPSADQFLEGGFQLATMVKPQNKPAIDAPVVLAAAPAPNASPAPAVRPAQPGASAEEMMHVAGYKTPESPREAAPVPVKPAQLKKVVAASSPKAAPVDALAPLPAAKAPATDKPKPKKAQPPKDPVSEQ